MVGKLIVKDLRAYKTMCVSILIAYMVVGSVFIFKYYSWHVYMMYGYMLVSFVYSYIVFSEKNLSTELLIVSLPVTRSCIVTARYITVFLISFFGMLMWFLNAIVADMIYETHRTDIVLILSFKTVFIAVFFITVHQSLFLPSSFISNKMGSVLSFIASLTIAIMTVPFIFHPYKHSYIYYFQEADIPLITILSLIIIFLFITSVILSLKFYSKKDI